MPYLETEKGQKVYYECHGQSGPAVILLHGLASSTRIWLRQIRTLQRSCRIYALDFPGHGYSDWQDSYSLKECAELVQLLMNQCGLQQASLIAISLGCSVALTFASHYPKRVDKLVLEGPVGGYHTIWNPLSWPDQLVFSLLPVALELSIFMFGHHATAHWLNTFGVKAKRNFKILESVQNKTDHKAIRDLLWDSACAPYAGQLERITAPTLLVRGSNDPMPKRFVNYIRAHLSKVTYVEVPDTRHLVAMEKPRKFNSLVMNFLNLVPGHQEKSKAHPA